MLACLSAWSEVQMICICHCHPIISCFIKIQNGLPFWWCLIPVIVENRPLNRLLLWLSLFNLVAWVSHFTASMSSTHILCSGTLRSGWMECSVPAWRRALLSVNIEEGGESTTATTMTMFLSLAMTTRRFQNVSVSAV